MTLVTGTPIGTVTSQEDTQLEGAAYIYFQNALAPELNRPDSNGWYWNLATTGSYGVYLLGCIQGVSLNDNTTINTIRCDTDGDRGVIQKRNHLEVDFTLLTLFPLTILQYLVHGSGAAQDLTKHTEAMGLGAMDNNTYWHIYMPKVYDDIAGDYVAFTLHRAQFVDAWKIDMKYGTPWELTGLKVYGFADVALPSIQQFATVLRADASAI